VGKKDKKKKKKIKKGEGRERAKEGEINSCGQTATLLQTPTQEQALNAGIALPQRT